MPPFPILMEPGDTPVVYALRASISLWALSTTSLVILKPKTSSSAPTAQKMAGTRPKATVMPWRAAPSSATSAFQPTEASTAATMVPRRNTATFRGRFCRPMIQPAAFLPVFQVV